MGGVGGAEHGDASIAVGVGGGGGGVDGYAACGGEDARGWRGVSGGGASGARG